MKTTLNVGEPYYLHANLVAEFLRKVKKLLRDRKCRGFFRRICGRQFVSLDINLPLLNCSHLLALLCEPLGRLGFLLLLNGLLFLLVREYLVRCELAVDRGGRLHTAACCPKVFGSSPFFMTVDHILWRGVYETMKEAVRRFGVLEESSSRKV